MERVHLPNFWKIDPLAEDPIGNKQVIYIWRLINSYFSELFCLWSLCYNQISLTLRISLDLYFAILIMIIMKWFSSLYFIRFGRFLTHFMILRKGLHWSYSEFYIIQSTKGFPVFIAIPFSGVAWPPLFFLTHLFITVVLCDTCLFDIIIVTYFIYQSYEYIILDIVAFC